MCIQSSGNFLIDYDKYVWRGFYVCQPYMKDELYSNCKKIGLPIPWILFYGFSWKTMAKNIGSGAWSKEMWSRQFSGFRKKFQMKFCSSWKVFWTTRKNVLFKHPHPTQKDKVTKIERKNSIHGLRDTNLMVLNDVCIKNNDIKFMFQRKWPKNC